MATDPRDTTVCTIAQEGVDYSGTASHARPRYRPEPDQGAPRSTAQYEEAVNGLVDGQYMLDPTPVMCEMSWTAALSNPGALGIHDEHGGAPVHIYVRDR